MKPADVLAASALIPRMNDWIGMNNRESQTVPVLEFREGLQKMGLLRKNKGRLLRTKLGTTLAKNPAKLAEHIASRLLPNGPGRFEKDAARLMLFYAATTNGRLPLAEVATLLNELGWRQHNQAPIKDHSLYWVGDGGIYETMVNLSDVTENRRDALRLSPVAMYVAHRALVE